MHNVCSWDEISIGVGRVLEMFRRDERRCIWVSGVRDVSCRDERSIRVSGMHGVRRWDVQERI